MKRKHLLLFAALLYCSISFSQKLSSKYDIIMGPVEEEKRSSFEKTVCSFEDYYIIIRRVKKKVSLEKLNNKMVSIKALDITEFPDSDGKKRVYSNVISFNGKIYLITNKYIKKKTSTNYYQVIDPDNFEIGSEVKVLDETDLSVKKKTKARFVFGGIGMSKLMAEVGEMAANNLIFSPNDKKMLTYNKGITDRDGPDIIDVLIQNDNFEVEWENDSIALPYNSLLFDIETVKLNNNGDVFLTGIEYKEKRKTKVKDSPNYSYHLIGIFNKGSEIKDYDIKLKDKFITSCQFKFDKNNLIIVSGFYSDKDASSVKGAFFMTLNTETKEIEKQSIKPFGFEFIVSGLSEKEQERQKKKEEKGKKVELLNFRLDDIIINDNGSYSLIAEQFEITTYTTYTPGTNGQPGQTVTHYVYNYNDIIVVNFTKDGEINWMTKINKYQRTTDDGGYYSSYAYTTKDNSIFFIYNDHPDNLNQTQPNKFKTYRRGKETVQMIVEVDRDGDMQKEVLFKTEKGEVVLRPKSCMRSEAGDLMLFANRKNEYQFDLIKFR